MDAAQFQQIPKQGGCVNLSTRAKWRLSGGDRVRYLNGQVTQDIRKATAKEALYGCVTNAKGKIEGDIFVHAYGDALLIDAEASLRESLGARLERYIIADDAVLEDITEEWDLWHCFAENHTAIEKVELPETGAHQVHADRLQLPGVDLWFPTSNTSAAVVQVPCPVIASADFETLRILRQIPRFPNELNPDTFPQEAGLEKRAMSFSKGCYIGQEILSRIKTTGKMPRQLVAWETVELDEEISVGLLLLTATESGENRRVGEITSMTRHPVSGAWYGLAYLRQGLATADSVLLVGNDPANILTSVKISPAVYQ